MRGFDRLPSRAHYLSGRRRFRTAIVNSFVRGGGKISEGPVAEIAICYLAVLSTSRTKLMKITSLLVFLTLSITAFSQNQIAEGEQPQVTQDQSGIIRLVYGKGDQILYASSSDKGKTFSQPVVVGVVKEMHLGMTRGPQLASSRDFSVVTSIDKAGNIHSFMLTHKTETWEKTGNVNDIEGSAPEGLMSIAADERNNFYAVWLDLRANRKNNICFSSLNEKGSWSKNQFAYRSPESHVCECCKPSIAVNRNHVSIMFRNWLHGARDLYLVSSRNKGRTFSDAQKLGLGTWPLKGCPMDGGGVSIDSESNIHTAWQREGNVFYAKPGKPEQKVGEGRGVGLSGQLIHWQKGPDLFLRGIHGDEEKVGEGTALRILQLHDQSILAIWENNGKILSKNVKD